MFAGDVEVDEVLTNNDVGDAITIISHLADTKGNVGFTSWPVSMIPNWFIFIIIHLQTVTVCSNLICRLTTVEWKFIQCDMLSIRDQSDSLVHTGHKLHQKCLSKQINSLGRIHLRRTHILGVWPGRTARPAAEESDWWIASTAQKGPKYKKVTHSDQFKLY